MPSYDIKYDIKKALPALYAPKPGGFHVVDVPELAFLMVDGHGDPNVVARVRRRGRGAVHAVLHRARDRQGRAGPGPHRGSARGAVERRRSRRLRGAGEERVGLDDDDLPARVDHSRHRRSRGAGEGGGRGALRVVRGGAQRAGAARRLLRRRGPRPRRAAPRVPAGARTSRSTAGTTRSTSPTRAARHRRSCARSCANPCASSPSRSTPPGAGPRRRCSSSRRGRCARPCPAAA